MKTRTKALITALVVVVIVWAVIIAAWFRKAGSAGNANETNDGAFLGALILGGAIVAGIVVFASIMSGKKPPPPAWADPDRRLPEARVHHIAPRTPPR